MNRRHTTVADVLAYFGKDVSHLRNGFIFSPFRDENSPSFHISPSGRGWKDFGDGAGGGVLDLVIRLSGKDKREAMKILLEIEDNPKEYLNEVTPRVQSYKAINQPKIRIYSTGPLTSEWLLKYSSDRGIRKSIIEKYCTEVVVRPARAGGEFKSFIGFPNNDGGFVLRGCSSKRCTSSCPTYISTKGEFTLEQSSNCISVFEGFFDFLSFVELYSDDSLMPVSDVCVLNSVVNKDKVLSHILSYDAVRLFLDNDKAGWDTAAFISKEARTHGIIVSDESATYGSWNDLNEYLMSRMK